jgi:hypothetical protein
MATVTVVAWVLLDKLHMPTAWLDQYSPTIITLFMVFAFAMAAFHIVKKQAPEEEVLGTAKIA